MSVHYHSLISLFVNVTNWSVSLYDHGVLLTLFCLVYCQDTVSRLLIDLWFSQIAFRVMRLYLFWFFFFHVLFLLRFNDWFNLHWFLFNRWLHYDGFFYFHYFNGNNFLDWSRLFGIVHLLNFRFIFIFNLFPFLRVYLYPRNYKIT
jgi:hypothetical protein